MSLVGQRPFPVSHSMVSTAEGLWCWLVHEVANVTCDATAAAEPGDLSKPGARISVAFRFSYFLKIQEI